MNSRYINTVSALSWYSNIVIIIPNLQLSQAPHNALQSYPRCLCHLDAPSGRSYAFQPTRAKPRLSIQTSMFALRQLLQPNRQYML